jgi:glutamate--cysteine ligase
MAVGLENPKRVPAREQSELVAGCGRGLYRRVCFKLGPPTLIGAELEWLTVQGECSPSGPLVGPRPRPAALTEALGPYAARSVAPDSPALSLDSPALSLPGGSQVTIGIRRAGRTFQRPVRHGRGAVLGTEY